MVKQGEVVKYRYRAHGSVVERPPHMREVPGSNPGEPTMRVSYTFIFVYLVLLFTPGYTVWQNGGLAAQDTAALTYLFLRLTGLYAFILIFIQIILGAYMDFWRGIFGSRILNFHATQGLVAYGLVLTHPAFFLLNATVKNIPSPLGLLVPQFSSAYEIYLSFGKVGFILLTVAVFAAKFRNASFFQKHWRKFHILNYITFWFIFVHSFNVGSDTKATPFAWFYPIMAVLVVLSIFYRRIYIPFLKSARASR